MRLDRFSGAAIYLDTNILYMYVRSDPEQLPKLKLFFQRVVRGEVEAYISVPVLDELYYRLLLAQVKDNESGSPLTVLRTDLARVLSQYGAMVAESIQRFLKLPHFYLVGVEPQDGHAMFHNIAAFSLLPRDALHMAIINRLRITHVASDDTDFDRISHIERHWLINPAKQQ